MCSNISRSSAAARRKLGGQFHASKIWAKKLPLISWFQKTFPDWKAGVVTAIVIATLTLVLNTAFLIWAIRKDSPGPNGLGTLFKGDCEQIGNWNKVGHGIINVISTVSSSANKFILHRNHDPRSVFLACPTIACNSLRRLPGGVSTKRTGNANGSISESRASTTFGNGTLALGGSFSGRYLP